MGKNQTEIANGIIDRLKQEQASYVKYPAIGRLDVELNDVSKVFWLTESEDHGSIQLGRGFLGGQEVVGIGQSSVARISGEPNIYKNSLVGEILIKHAKGRHTYNAPSGKVQLQIITKATYRPILKEVDAIEGEMKMNDGSPLLRWRSLRQWLKGLQHVGSQDDTSEIEGTEAVSSDHGLQTKESDRVGASSDTFIDLTELDSASNEYKELLAAHAMSQQVEANLRARKKADSDSRQSYIRTSQELRVQHILDPIQEEAKREHFYDDYFVVIEGGPGTGKTTTLIQRIKFLTARTIEEYFVDRNRDFTPEMKSLLFQSGPPWLFISPSRLLKDYLKQAMSAEHLTQLEDCVWDWPTLKNELMRKYGLYGTKSKLQPVPKGSKEYRPTFYKKEVRHLRTLEAEFTEAFLDKVWFRVNGIERAVWQTQAFRTKAKSLQSIIDAAKENRNMESTLRMFRRFQEVESDWSNQIARRGNDIISKRVREVFGSFDRDDAVKHAMVALHQEISDKRTSDFVAWTVNAITDALKESARRTLGVDERITRKSEKVIAVIPSLENWHAEEADVVAFAYSFSRITQGLAVNIFDRLVDAFRDFRKESGYRNAIRQRSGTLFDLMLSSGNKQIHPEEEAFLLGFINRMMASFSRLYPSDFREENEPNMHVFAKGYVNAVRPVIAVDEAADFALIDLDCIATLKHTLIGSMTLCGDLMQRTTTEGLSSWSDLNSMLSRRISHVGDFVKVYPLKKSYRQSEKILRVARLIYERQRNTPAPYVGHQPESENEPPPQLIVAANSNERLDLVAQSILQISEDYGVGVVPTIAVFVPTESEVRHTADALNEHPSIMASGIKIEACTGGVVIGVKSSVRVFSVEFIKGLEFEAVIFHDFDRLSASYPEDLVGRLLYVGLSRAAYHLVITTANGFNENLNYLHNVFETRQSKEAEKPGKGSGLLSLEPEATGEWD